MLINQNVISNWPYTYLPAKTTLCYLEYILVKAAMGKAAFSYI